MWVFLIYLFSKKALDHLIASLADAVKVILGGPLNSEELLVLPSERRGCKPRVFYTDVFRRKILDEGFTEPEVGRYCDSPIHQLSVQGIFMTEAAV